MLAKAYYKRLLLAGILSIIYSSIIAQEPYQSSKPHQKSDSIQSREKSSLDTIQVLDDVIVLGKKRFKETIPAQILGPSELETLNSLSVADAIRFFSGVQLKDYGGIGGLKTIDIRSMGTNHMGVFYDGIQLGNAQNGQVDLGKFSLDNVESISLYHGQKSEIFQSAKDFGSSGTIYITTRKPKFKENEKGHMKATLRSGSFDLFNPSLLYEYKISDHVSSSFSGEWINASGKYNFRYRRRDQQGEIKYDTTAVRKNGDINSTRMEAGLHGVTNKGTWTLRGYNYNSERGIPGAIVNNVFRRGERLWDTNSFIQGTLNQEITNDFKTLLNIKYAYDYTHYQNNDYREYQSDNKYRQKEIYVSSANLYSILNNWDISLAVDFQWNKLSAEFNNPEKDELFPFPTRYITMIAGATAFEWWKFKGQASGLVYLSRETVKRYAKSPNKSIFTPAFFISFQPLEKHNFTLRAYFKQMFRMPTFNDLYYTDMGNPFLKPEHTTQYNIGFKYTKNFHFSFWKHLDIQADTYYNEVIDKIIAYPKGQQFRWTMLNLGEVKIRGIDVSLTNVFELFPDMILDLKGQYTYQKAQDYTNPKDNFYKHQIPYIPWHSASAMASIKYKGWALHYSFIYTGERYNQQENYYFNHTQPWYTSDLAVVKQIALNKRRELKVSAEVSNLFSQDYDVILNYPMPKANYRFLISIDL